ncbi:LysR family transcriptional regulator [Pseudomonas sp. nanlin1]|uniref:LysR family transcriptional regulator n=1 Tax=Pseudomonas sp. nanlin1 TaxID=3040605 RepID=UPI00388D046B
MSKGLGLARPTVRSSSERVDWNLLRTFQAIAQELSISRAAVRLHLSQPAVSQALKRLEEQLGTALIERNGPRFQLTAAGIETLRIANDVQGQFAQLDAAIEGVGDQVVGKVRLLSVDGVRCRAYDQALASLRRRFPGLAVEIEVQPNDEILRALEQNTATFGLAINPTRYPWLAQECMTREHYRFYCGPEHPLFGVSGISIDSLKQEPLILFTSDLLGGTLNALADFRHRHGWRGPVMGCSANSQEVLRLVLAGYGIGCLPHPLYEREQARGELWPLPPERVCTVDINLLWNKEQRLSRAEAVFLAGLREATALLANA